VNGSIDLDKLAAVLADVQPRLGIEASPVQLEQLHRYLDLLQRWNGTYNLTALRDPAQMLSHHLLDCLAVVVPLSRHLGGRAAKMLDVGSGGGLPGVVLALMLPSLDVTCVDTVGKKAAFIRQVAAELQLPNLHALHQRVEQGRGRYEVITSRAFATLADFCRLTRSQLAEGGVWMAMKGKNPLEEIAELPGDVEVFHVEHLAVPGLEAERCLVWMRLRSD
jgi:16S rRNA (guanine527-N7)-methyltransferase